MAGNNFPLEKILNVTAREYCASVGKKLSDYDLVGVHARASTKEDLVEVFQNLVPNHAEIVVKYKPHYAVAATFFEKALVQQAEGTALIPKK